VVETVEGKIKEAYGLLCEFTRSYEKIRLKSGRAVTAALAMALFREGLPMAVVKQLPTAQPRPGPSGLLVVNLVRPGAVVHELLVTPGGFDEVRRLLGEARSQYTTTPSLVRSLQYEAAGFRDAFDLNITPLDAYALKLHVLGLAERLSGKYSTRRLSFVVEHLLSRAYYLLRVAP